MKKFDFSKLAKPNVRSLKPYQAKEISCRVKLDANESPYPPKTGPNKFVFKMLNRYPDPEASELKKAAAGSFGVPPENILIGNGSDELIYYLTMAFGGTVLSPVPTFSMYEIISMALGEKYIGVQLDGSFDLETGKTLAAIKKYQPRLIFLSSPNNPTGNCFSSDRILKIVEASRGLVIVDEAYQPFSSKKGFIPLLKDYRNLAILRTLSKTGFAALRVGFLIADRDLISEVNKVRLPFNTNSLSQAIALKAFQDKKTTEANIRAINSERGKLMNKLLAIEGVDPFPSEANFILFRVSDADIVFHRLLKSGVLVRNLDSVVKNALRVTVGTPSENNYFIKSLKSAVAENEQCRFSTDTKH